METENMTTYKKFKHYAQSAGKKKLQEPDLAGGCLTKNEKGKKNQLGAKTR